MNQELRDLKRELYIVRQERDIVEKSASHLLGSEGRKYKFMKNHSSYFAVDQMAQILGVSRSGYYDFINRKDSKRAIENEELTCKIKDIFAESYETYGSPRVHAELTEQGYDCSRHRIARLMKKTISRLKCIRSLRKRQDSLINLIIGGRI